MGSFFGCPGKILNDNEGEFNNGLLRDLGELLNIDVLTCSRKSVE